MQWETILSGALSSSPTALILGFAVWTLWGSNQKKDTEIQRLNQARVDDLLEVAKRDD